jgi:hypothetical protein
MMRLRILLCAIVGAVVHLSLTVSARADAASYIRTLFDATIATPDGTAGCQIFTPLAQFSAGQHWPGFDAAERGEFDAAFCTLALDALARLRDRYPDLSLTILDSHKGPSDMDWVRSKATADGADMPVDWLVGRRQGAPYLADLKVMGVSLAIMLRSLAAGAPGESPAAVVHPWQQVLNRALPE